MSPSPRIKDATEVVFAILIVLLCMGLAGNDDFDNAMHSQKVMCEKTPKPEFCKEITK